MVKSLLVHFPEIGRLKDEGENTPLNLFVCKSVMKGVSWGLLFLWLGVISYIQKDLRGYFPPHLSA